MPHGVSFKKLKVPSGVWRVPHLLAVRTNGANALDAFTSVCEYSSFPIDRG
jgi:hypothetical protein